MINSYFLALIGTLLGLSQVVLNTPKSEWLPILDSNNMLTEEDWIEISKRCSESSDNTSKYNRYTNQPTKFFEEFVAGKGRVNLKLVEFG